MPRDMVSLPVLGRAADIRVGSADETARTVEVVWTTGAVVRRWDWDAGEIDEELVVEGATIRLDRLNSGAPFLANHDLRRLDAIIGVVVEGSARIEGGVGVARVRFSDRADVEPIWRDIAGGIIRNVSVGYRVHAYEVIAREGQRPLWRAVDWEPMELSAVPIGADPGAHVRHGPAGTNFCAVIRDGAQRKQEEAAMAEEKRNQADGEGVVERASVAAQEMKADKVSDSEAVRAAERERVAAIVTLCATHKIDRAAQDHLIMSGASVDAAREFVLDLIAKRDGEEHGAKLPARVIGAQMDETETRRRGMEDALFAAFAGGEVADYARAWAGRSLVSLAVERLGERRMPEGFGERESLLRRAFHSTGDFPALFENALNRSLAARYADAEPTYRLIARREDYADFRAHTTVRAGDFPALKEVDPSGGELRGGTFTAAAETTVVKAYGVRVGLTRQMLVNDRLNAIAQVIADQGAAVARFEEATFYSMMLSGANADGPTLTETGRQVFNTTDGTKAGSGSAVNVTSMGAAAAALMKRTSADGAKLGLFPAIVLTGPDKWLEAAQLLAPVQAVETSKVNPFQGRLRVYSTAHISGNAWYVFADPSVAPVFRWGYLDGYTAPRFRMEEVFGLQGTQLSLEHDFGCGAIDFRGGFKNPGA